MQVFYRNLQEHGVLMPNELLNLFANLEEVIATNQALYDLMCKARVDNLGKVCRGICGVSCLHSQRMIAARKVHCGCLPPGVLAAGLARLCQILRKSEICFVVLQ